MIKVVAKFFPKEKKIDRVIELARELVEKTVLEEGCIKYEMYQDEKDPKVLLMLEEWESIEFLNRHMSSEYFTKIVPQLSEYMDKEPEISVCKKIL